jgi:dUTP diphosphatase
MPVDSDYRGDIGAILINHSKEDFDIKPGDSFARLVVALVSVPTSMSSRRSRR